MAGHYVSEIELRTNIEKVLANLKETQDRVDKLEGKEYKVNLDIDTKTLESAIQKLDKMLDSLGKGTGDFKQFENLSKELSAITSEVQSFSKAFGKLDDSGAKSLLSSIQNIDKSLSELSQHILNVNKNIGDIGDNTNGAVKQVENIGNAAADATKQVGKLAEVQSKLGGKSNISSSNTGIDDFNTKLQESKKYVNEIRQAFMNIVGKASNRDSLLKQYPKLGEFKNRTSIDKARSFLDTNKWKDFLSTLPQAHTYLESIGYDFDRIYKLSNEEIKWFKGLSPEELLSNGWDKRNLGQSDLKEIRVAYQKAMKDAIQVDNSSATNASTSAIEEENNALEQTAQSAEKAANSKKKFANANKEVKDSANVSVNSIKDENNALIEIEKQASNQQKKWQAFQKEQQNYLSNQFESTAIERNAKIYQELIDTISRYSEVSKRVSSGKALDGDIQEVQKLEEKISKLQNEPILSISQIEKSERELVKLYNKLDDLERKNQQSNSTKANNQENTQKLEKEKQIWNDLTNSLQRYNTVMQRMASGKALSSDNEEAAKLKQRIDELKDSDILSSEKTNAAKEKLRQIDQTVTDLKAKLKKTTADSVQNSIDKYQKIYDKLSTAKSPQVKNPTYTDNLGDLANALRELRNYKETLSGVSEITEKQTTEIQRLETNCEKAANALKNMSAAEKGFSQLSVSKLLQRANKDLDENTRYSAKAKAGIQALIDKLNSGAPNLVLQDILNDLIKIENEEIKAGRTGKSLLDIFKTKSVHGFLGQAQSFLSMYVGFYGIVNGVRNAVSTVIDLNTQITELAKVSEASSKQIYNDFNSYADIAKEVRGTISDTISATTAWSKNGYSIPDAKELAEISQLYRNVGDGINIDEANESLISTLKGFKLEADEAEHIVDVFNEVSKYIGEVA